jgi:hypothetical protein
LLSVGSFTLPLGSPVARRGCGLGVRPPYRARIFPGLARWTGDPYPRTRVSDSAIFVLTGVTLLVTGLLLA